MDRDVGQLEDRLAGWLEPAQAEGLLKVSVADVERTEDQLGTYTAPGLLITAPSRRQVMIAPHARVIFGGTGRVDLVSGPNRAMLFHDATGSWKWAVRSGTGLKKTDLTEESFLAVLNDLLA